MPCSPACPASAREAISNRRERGFRSGGDRRLGGFFPGRAAAGWPFLISPGERTPMETGSDYERFGANTEQAQYWDTAAAPIWVALQEKIDRRMVPVDDLLLERSALAPGHEVVDVGCGTGALLPALARRVAAGGSVLGVDISG